METQWQRALEIITSPGNSSDDQCTSIDRRSKTINVSKLDKNKADGVAGLYHHHSHNRPENEIFETPTSSRERRRHEDSEDNNSSNNTGDKLQQYIELVLYNYMNVDSL